MTGKRRERLNKIDKLTDEEKEQVIIRMIKRGIFVWTPAQIYDMRTKCPLGTEAFDRAMSEALHDATPEQLAERLRLDNLEDNGK